jgi:hypothetical protein
VCFLAQRIAPRMRTLDRVREPAEHKDIRIDGSFQQIREGRVTPFNDLMWEKMLII